MRFRVVLLKFRNSLKPRTFGPKALHARMTPLKKLNPSAQDTVFMRLLRLGKVARAMRVVRHTEDAGFGAAVRDLVFGESLE